MPPKNQRLTYYGIKKDRQLINAYIRYTSECLILMVVKWKTNIYHTVRTIRKSRKTKIYHTVGTIRKSRKTKIYHTVGTIRKSRKTKIYHTVGTIRTSNRKIVDKEKIDTPNTQIHDCSVSWLDTGTSIKSGGVKLVLWRLQIFRQKAFVLLGVIMFEVIAYFNLIIVTT
jgi:hypothetical protein